MRHYTNRNDVWLQFADSFTKFINFLFAVFSNFLADLSSNSFHDLFSFLILVSFIQVLLIHINKWFWGVELFLSILFFGHGSSELFIVFMVLPSYLLKMKLFTFLDVMFFKKKIPVSIYKIVHFTLNLKMVPKVCIESLNLCVQKRFIVLIGVKPIHF